MSTNITNEHNKIIMCLHQLTMWLINKVYVADSFATKIIIYFNNNNKQPQQNKHLLATF